jgi:Peptidase family M28
LSWNQLRSPWSKRAKAWFVNNRNSELRRGVMVVLPVDQIDPCLNRKSVDLASRPNWKLRVTCATIILVLVAVLVWLLRMTQMPLRSYVGPLFPLTAEQSDLRDRLSADVRCLSVTVGERSMERAGSLEKTTQYLRENLEQAGYIVTALPYSVGGQRVANLEAIRTGTDTASGSVIVGAHYDSVAGTVGANDNGTGVAATLELARLLQGSKLRKTVRFLFFVNEEPPYFQTENMGSWVYARQLRHEGVPVSVMISLETIGFYSDAPDSQKYPPVLGLFYPSRGNFIGFVGNPKSRDLVRRSVRRFRESTSFPSEGVAAPPDWPGVGWSDQWSFWQENYPAVMITDTAIFRYPYYHTPRDTFDKVDFEKAARVVDGVRQIVEMLANEP